MKKNFLLITGLLFLGQAVAEVPQTSQRRGTVGANPGTMTNPAQPSTARAARQTISARSGTPVVAAAPVVAARAATKQNVVQTGVGITAANVNTTVSEECKTKYYGCMDSFCMLENDNGGRCGCSDKKSDLDNVLAEIEKLDTQTRNMATTGVEKIELGTGEKADYVSNTVKSTANEFKTDSQTQPGTKTRRRASLDLSVFDSQPTFGFEDGEVAENADLSAIQGKTGDTLHNAVRNICTQQIPECSKDIRMLQMMYAQTIQSDCRSYENYLKKMKDESSKKVQVAERALREAALESYEAANKWDLGQCAGEMRKCMQDEARGGCGGDWAGCVGIVAAENARSGGLSSRIKTYDIAGSATKIQIAASTYDALLSKKPLCQSVTNNCVAAVSKDKDAVWNVFLREIAPTLKSAELQAESKRRTNCIGNISECFRKGCTDTMDPNDKEGSFDLCLSRPEAMLNICKVQLNECGISTASPTEAKKSMIWDFVTARLAAMRVDSCTKEVKSCLQSDDRCGEDYTKCVGLDTDSIVRMCPYDKLVGCQQVYEGKDIRGSEVYEEIANMVQGIFLGIDNNMMQACQKAADEAMVKICGGTENCDNLAVDQGIGSRSLEYKICGYTGNANTLDINYAGCKTNISQISDDELRSNTPLSGVLDGVVFWESVDFDETGKLKDISNYMQNSGTILSQTGKEKVESELAQLQRSINTAISAIESDPTVKYCMTGREVQGMKVEGVRQRLGSKEADAARFPDLTKQMRLLIASYAIKAARDNYNKKFDELNGKLLEDQVAIAERVAKINEKDALDARRSQALKSCKALATGSSLPASPTPPKNGFGQVLGVFMIAGGAVAAPFTGGARLAMSAAGIAAVSSENNATSTITPSAADLTASQSLSQWNYKQVVTTTFNWETLVCTRSIRSQGCKKTKNPLFKAKYCKEWNDESTSSKDFQF